MKRVLFLLIFWLPFLVLGQIKDYSMSTDISWFYIGNPSFSPSNVNLLSLGVTTTNIPFIAFQDLSSSGVVSVMQHSSSGWVYAGDPGISPGQVYSTCLVINPANIPYLAYEDVLDSLKSMVKMFDGTNWVPLGGTSFSPPWNSLTNLAFNPSGIPYISFVNMVSLKASVMKFNGSGWEYVGIANFSPRTSYASLAFNSSGEPFIAVEGPSQQGIFMMRFNGSNWINFGTEGPVSASNIAQNSMKISLDGFAYIAYSDYDQNQKVSVIRNDGITWTTIGPPGFSSSPVYFAYLAISAPGNLFVASDDSSLANVYTFNGTNWEHVGNPDFSIDPINAMSFILSPSGQSYAAFISNISGKISVMKYGYPEIINDKIISNLLSIYPNPTSNKITIDLLKSAKSAKTIEIYNATGSLFYEMKSNEDRVTMPVNEFPAGMYFITVKSDNSIWSGKFCKM